MESFKRQRSTVIQCLYSQFKPGAEEQDLHTREFYFSLSSCRLPTTPPPLDTTRSQQQSPSHWSTCPSSSGSSGSRSKTRPMCTSRSPYFASVSFPLLRKEECCAHTHPVRVVAFALRAILIGSRSLGKNLNVFIADEVMFGVGFFALLYSAFTLVLDRFVSWAVDRMSTHTCIMI
jgi:hypothetical protein